MHVSCVLQLMIGNIADSLLLFRCLFKTSFELRSPVAILADGICVACFIYSSCSIIAYLFGRLFNRAPFIDRLKFCDIRDSVMRIGRLSRVIATVDSIYQCADTLSSGVGCDVTAQSVHSINWLPCRFLCMCLDCGWFRERSLIGSSQLTSPTSCRTESTTTYRASWQR